MYVLLQVYPPEAADLDVQRDVNLDVIAMAETEEAMEDFLAAYEKRYVAACREHDEWIMTTSDATLDKEHDAAHDRLSRQYRVHGSLISGTTFQIVESQMGVVGPRENTALLEIGKLSVRKGDTVVLGTPHMLDSEQVERLKSVAQPYIPDGVKLMVLSGGLSIGVLQQADETYAIDRVN